MFQVYLNSFELCLEPFSKRLPLLSCHSVFSVGLYVLVLQGDNFFSKSMTAFV